MTSNDIDIIPKELYRAGRIDRSFQLFGLRTDKEVEEFAQKVYQTIKTHQWI
jgi:ATP-dependent 26S proteasome regulatory subunit